MENYDRTSIYNLWQVFLLTCVDISSEYVKRTFYFLLYKVWQLRRVVTNSGGVTNYEISSAPVVGP